MDDWLDITNAARTAPAHGPRVTLAYRTRHKKGLPQVEISLSAALVAALGWTPGTTRLRILAAADRRAIAFRPAEQGKRLGQHGGGASASLMHRMEWIAGQARPATTAPHEIRADGMLVVQLPDWALPSSRPTAAEPPPAPLPPATPAAAEPPARSEIRTKSAPETQRLIAEAKAQNTAPPPLPREKLTKEREALFRQLWPDARVSVAAILQRINALPGPGYAAGTSMYSLAIRLGLDPKRGGTPEAAPKREQVSPLEEDEREAEAMIRADPERRGARWVAEEYGWPLDRAQRLVAQVRKAMADEAAAAQARGVPA